MVSKNPIQNVHSMCFSMNRVAMRILQKYLIVLLRQNLMLMEYRILYLDKLYFMYHI
jgi:hypothetical protein